MRLGYLLTCALGALALLACEAGGGGEEIDDNGGEGLAGQGGDGVGGFNTVGGGSQGGNPNEITEVYGHGPNTLYRLDPVTKDVTEVGAFSPCSFVIDIAIDKDNNIFGTTDLALWRIDRDTAACTHISNGSYPNSLSFVPEGTLEPTQEVLVGYDGDIGSAAQYVRIDTTTGAKTSVGAITGGLTSSGDIVSVKDGASYLTVQGTGCPTDDCLIEVNPLTGDLVKNWGPVGYAQVFGLAFWGGRAYGFSNSGALFEITFNANDVTSTPITIANPPPGLQFWGAGSSTHVPLTLPE